jgi:hypothetical protein
VCLKSKSRWASGDPPASNAVLMRFTAVACLLAGCHAFQPLHLLHSRALAHRSSLRVSSGSNEGVNASSAIPIISVDAVDFDKLAASVQGELACIW